MGASGTDFGCVWCPAKHNGHANSHSCPTRNLGQPCAPIRSPRGPTHYYAIQPRCPFTAVGQVARGFLQQLSSLDQSVPVDAISRTKHSLLLAKTLWLQGSRDRALHVTLCNFSNLLTLSVWQILRTSSNNLGRLKLSGRERIQADLTVAKVDIKWAKYAALARSESVKYLVQWDGNSQEIHRVQNIEIRQALLKAAGVIEKECAESPHVIAKAFFSLAHHCDTVLNHTQEIEQSPEHEQVSRYYTGLKTGFTFSRQVDDKVVAKERKGVGDTAE